MKTHFFAGLFLCFAAFAQGQAASPSEGAKSAITVSPEAEALKSANALFQTGKYADAATAFRAIINKDPKSEEAQAGLVRSLLHNRNLDEAEEAGKKAMEAAPASAPVKAAAGDVAFRLGKFADAEAAYRGALKLDSKSARAWFGMGRMYDMVSMHHRAKEVFAKAHELDPGDEQIFEEWFATLSYAERLDAAKKRAGDHPTERQQEEIDYLSAVAKKEPWVLASGVKPAEIKIVRFGRKLEFAQQRDANIPIAQGFAVQVKFNDRATSELKLDTGAGGIILGRRLAEKAGFVKLANTYIGGIGDHGWVRAETGWIDKINIGPLEFHNCLVRVSSRNDINDDQGLIGTDVFKNFLITLDFKDWKMLLNPLPRPPNAPADDREVQDRYIAPEMQSYTKIWRFGHNLVIPVVVSDQIMGNFILDTGAETNNFSSRIADQVTKTGHGDWIVQGVSGKVNQVQSGDKAILQFARIRARSDDFPVISFDGVSENEGTEIAGLIGIKTLVQTKMTIDYRDGLVNFEVYNFKPARE